jgi:predicted nucleic acid-binding protein
MRRSQKLESLGAGYRRAHFLASWGGIYCGTYRRHTPAATCCDDHHRGRSTWWVVYQIRQARDDQQLARAYQALHEALEFFRSIRILPFNLPEIRRYRQLRAEHRRIGTNDLRIAAIVLEQQAILVTRNTTDFADISELQFEDW